MFERSIKEMINSKKMWNMSLYHTKTFWLFAMATLTILHFVYAALLANIIVQFTVGNYAKILIGIIITIAAVMCNNQFAQKMFSVLSSGFLFASMMAFGNHTIAEVMVSIIVATLLMATIGVCTNAYKESWTGTISFWSTIATIILVKISLEISMNLVESFVFMIVSYNIAQELAFGQDCFDEAKKILKENA